MIIIDEKSTENVKMKRMIKILERKIEFEYDNNRNRQYKEFKCANIHDISQ